VEETCLSNDKKIKYSIKMQGCDTGERYKRTLIFSTIPLTAISLAFGEELLPEVQNN
jgi:hypothetical protein